MTDGIGRIFGGNSYNLGGYVPQRKDGQAAEAQKEVSTIKENPVDPSKVMDFLSNNNIVPAARVNSKPEISAETQDRIASYMENFEMIYGIIVEEFGEENAPMVMDFAMDYLMGMAE